MLEVFAFVKTNLSEAKRRKDAASGKSGAGKGAAAFVPASAHSHPERCTPDRGFLLGINRGLHDLVNTASFCGCYPSDGLYHARLSLQHIADRLNDEFGLF